MSQLAIPYPSPGHLTVISEKFFEIQGTCQVSVIRSLEEFKTLRKDWEVLLEKAGVENHCLHHAWLLTWLEHFAEEQLFIVVIRNEKRQLIGAAPLVIRKSPTGLFSRFLKRVQFIGTDPCVYENIEFIRIPGLSQESMAEAVSRELVLHSPLWDVIDLRHTEQKESLLLLKESMKKHLHKTVIEKSMTIPYLQLPKTVEAYEATTASKNWKKDLKRVKTRLKKDFSKNLPELIFHADPDELEVLLGHFFDRHADYWSEKGSKSNFQRFPELRNFYRDIFKTSLPVRFSTLKIRDEILCQQISFWRGEGQIGHLTVHNEALKHYRPGILHIEALIHDTITQGGVCFEFGRGDESYKNQWTEKHLVLWNLLAFQTITGKFFWQLDEKIKTLRDLARSIQL